MASDEGDDIEALKARVAQLEQAAHAEPKPRQGWLRRRWKWFVGVPVALFVGLFIFSAITGPRTVGDLAKMYKDQCIRDKGNGYWVASSGITLDKFCEATGSLQALQDARKAHPEDF